MDPDITDIACQGLHGMELGDKRLIVQRASIGSNKMPLISGPAFQPLEMVSGSGPPVPTSILLLLNMINPEDLYEDEDYEGNILFLANLMNGIDIFADVQEECSKYGNILEVKIPRPMEEEEVAGVGKIFVRYKTSEEAHEAHRALAGRRFAERTVIAAFQDEVSYEAGDI